jgi:hypothetical protein
MAEFVPKPFDWGAFNRAMRKKEAKAKAKGKKTKSGKKSDAWRAYVTGRKKR